MLTESYVMLGARNPSGRHFFFWRALEPGGGWKGVGEAFPSSHRLPRAFYFFDYCTVVARLARWNPSEGGDRGGLEMRVASVIFGS